MQGSESRWLAIWELGLLKSRPEVLKSWPEVLTSVLEVLKSRTVEVSA